jgi:ribosomal-protein-serine acetyltransferase
VLARAAMASACARSGGEKIQRVSQGPYHSQISLFDELVGERVVVRPYWPEDAKQHYMAIEESREHLARWLPWVSGYASVADSHDYIARERAHWLLRDDMGLGIFERATGRYLGGTGLHPRNWSIGVFEIGYWLRTSAEGHGFMTEAVRLLTDFALDTLGANRVFIRCDARNVRSAGVARRLGFIEEARLRNELRAPDGSLRDTLVFSRIPTDPRPWRPEASAKATPAG